MLKPSLMHERPYPVDFGMKFEVKQYLATQPANQKRIDVIYYSMARWPSGSLVVSTFFRCITFFSPKYEFT